LNLDRIKAYLFTHMAEIAGACMALGLVILLIYTRAWFNYTSLIANFLFAIALILVLVNKKAQGYTKLEFGDKMIWIPLLLIIASSLTALFFTDDIGLDSFYILYMCFMFMLYLVGKELGAKVFGLIAVASLMQSIICIAEGFFDFNVFAENGVRSSGLTHNPDAVSAFLAFSVLFYRGKLRWLVFIPLLAIYFTGSWVAVFSLGVVGAYILYNRGFKVGWKVVVSQLIAVLIIGVIFVNVNSVFGSEAGIWEKITNGFENRFDNYEIAFGDMRPWGHGFQFGFGGDAQNVIHNVPIIIGYEFGAIAGLAWIWIMGYCFFKSQGTMRHLILMVFLLSMGDCYLWRFNGMSPYFFVLVGVVSGMKFESSPEALIKKNRVLTKARSVWHKITINGKKVTVEERGSIYGPPYGMIIGTLLGILFIPVIISGGYWLIPLALLGISITGYLFYRAYWKKKDVNN